ncbi:MAG: c-type cytochrome [Acidiferrobacter sp.]
MATRRLGRIRVRPDGHGKDDKRWYQRAAFVLMALVPLHAWAMGRSARLRVDIALLAHEARLASIGRMTAKRQVRMQSDLGILGFLARSYYGQQGRSSKVVCSRIRILKRAFRDRNYGLLARGLQTLAHRYPVDFYGILPLRPTPIRFVTGQFLYKRLCADCHMSGTQNGPIPDLFVMARADSPATLVVEILAGVRGTRATAFANPLTSEQIASLAVYLSAKKPQVGGTQYSGD